MRPIRSAAVGGCIALICIFANGAGLAEPIDRDGWTLMPVPGLWERQLDGRFADHDGYAWYRCFVKVPADWPGDRDLTLTLDAVADACEVFFNGVKIGGTGSMPPEFRDGSAEAQQLHVPAGIVRGGQYNVIAIRVFDTGGPGGFDGPPPVLHRYWREIVLEGTWQFRTGDAPGWAEADPARPPAEAVFEKVTEGATPLRAPKQLILGKRLSPQQSLQRMTTADDLAIDLVLAEPDITQPVSISFDERGRLWVVEYRQYPYPAGLRMVSRDRFYRAVYDRNLPPPPYAPGSPFRGLDRISIHEDADGDGRFERHKVFLDGLNITTAIARGRGGVWVLSPPQLLFYPDADGDDAPDSDRPQVHLSGFGLEDTHAVTNSLRWGPDGWLYASQGSTVSAHVLRPGLDQQPMTATMGQLIWRYHPPTRRFEVFAEGGGNAFGVEIDSKGRIFSGHNGGNTRGFHYVQGAYLQKTFAKHGPLSNPYAFGHFPPMPHNDVPRFTHTFVIYEADALPRRYHGRLLGIEPLQGRVVLADIRPRGSTFQTRDLDRPLLSEDPAFRPVDIKLGPDDALYIADFTEQRISHGEHFQGYLDRESGRVYRLRAKDGGPAAPFDLSERSADELVGMLDHSNRWFRQTALRLIGDRRNPAIVPQLRRMIEQNTGRVALEALWALNLSGGFDEPTATKLLDHDDPHVRRWTVRLLGDEREVPPPLVARMARLAETEPHPEVRGQLASTARRLPAQDALKIIRPLLGRDEDAADPYIPLLLWWAVESNCASDRDAVLAMLEDEALWGEPLFAEHIAPRLMQRFAAAGARRDLLTCARLLAIAPNPESASRLMAGFERAYEGRAMTHLPDELVEALAKAGGGSLVLRVRRGEEAAIREALDLIADPSAPTPRRLELVRTFGEAPQPRCVPVLLDLLRAPAPGSSAPRSSGSEGEASGGGGELQRAALTALQPYDDQAIGRTIVDLYGRLPESARAAAQSLLTSRATWALQLVRAVDAGRIDPAAIGPDAVRRIRLHDSDELTALADKLWGGDERAPTTAEMRREIDRLKQVLSGGAGDPYHGKALYTGLCGACHTLFGEGGAIGPDLTPYQRDDLDALLLNIVNPNAEVREGFETFIITTTDDRTLTGFLADQTANVLILRGMDGQDISLRRADVQSMRAIGRSLMPENPLAGLTDRQVRDLLAYLRTAQPLNE